MFFLLGKYLTLTIPNKKYITPTVRYLTEIPAKIPPYFRTYLNNFSNKNPNRAFGWPLEGEREMVPPHNGTEFTTMQ